jgi:poly(hydroxyalkanoate) depolymerase family esterase
MRRRILQITVAMCCLALAVGVGISFRGGASSPGRSIYQHGYVSERGDVYRYAVYVPSTRRAGLSAPLVVVLHGCNMTADQMAAASDFNAIAERHRFIVLYPDVDASDAGYGRCWKGIWEPAAEGRDRGDAGAIAEMTTAVIARWHVDRSRVYAIGISAGGFETPILAVDYPDLYAAIGIHSGVAYGGGEAGCLAPSDTNTLAHAAFAAMGAHVRVMPVIVFHGDQDDTIPYRCGQQAVAQWLDTDNLILEQERRALLPLTPTSVSRAAVPGGHAYTVDSYADTAGCAVAQLWTVHGMGHFWSGGSAGSSSARFSDPRGPSASAASWAFFSNWRLTRQAHRCARTNH